MSYPTLYPNLTLALQFLALIAVIIYAWITHRQWKESNQQTKLLHQQVELTTRAWVSAEMVGAGPVTFDNAGARVGFAIRVTNIGQSPATSVDFRYKIVNSQSPSVVQIQQELGAPWTLPKGFSWGATLFPGKDFIQPINVTVEQGELDQLFVGFPEGALLLSIIGCVDYAIGSSDDHHQTFFHYSLFGIGDNGSTVPLMKGVDTPCNRIKFFTGGPIGSGAN